MATTPRTQQQIPKQEELEIAEFVSVQGMNTQEERSGIQDGFWSWLMNFQPIGRRTLRALNGKGADIYTAASGTITNGRTYLIGSTYYAILFFLDGSAKQIRLSDGATTTVGTAGTFYGGTGQYPACVDWGNSGILIVSTVAANAYWAWDGTTLYSPTGAAPTWLYPSGSTKTTMPTGIQGTAIEIYNQQVWIVNGRVILASAASVGTDFATADGGVNVTVQDSYVQDGYSGIKQLSGFLYLFAHAAVDVISDVQTVSATTTFLRVNVSPIIGTPWRDSIAALPSSLVFANTTGVYEVSGGQVRKVSDSFDGIFEAAKYPTASADESGYHPSAAIMTLNESVCYALTISMPDPDDTTQTYVPCLATWDGRRWFLTSQESNVIVLLGQDSDSSLTGWGSTGTTLFQMFKTASASLTKKAKSWFAEGKAGVTWRKQVQRVYAQFGNLSQNTPFTQFDVDTDSGSVAAPSFGGPIVWLNGSGGVIQFVNSGSQAIYFIPSGLPLVVWAGVSVICFLFGVTFATTIATVDVIGLYLGYVDYKQKK